MPTNHTTNYGLSQWVKSDQVRMEDFNADNAKIDAAIKAVEAAVPKVAAGTYTGDGAATRVIELGFTPKLVFVCDKIGHTVTSGNNAYSYYGGLALAGAPVTGSGHTILAVVEGGFQVAHAIEEYKYHVQSNAKATIYHYFAIG